MATKKLIKQASKAAEAAEIKIGISLERPITRGNDLSDQIHRQLTQLRRGSAR
jgi:hypothetical protein